MTPFGSPVLPLLKIIVARWSIVTLLIASLDRPIRFVVDAEYVNHALFKPFMQALHVIPISSSGGPRVILKALREAGKSLDAGDLVCIAHFQLPLGTWTGRISIEP